MTAGVTLNALPVALVEAALFHELLDSVGDAFLRGVAGEFEFHQSSGGFLSVGVTNRFGQFAS